MAFNFLRLDFNSVSTTSSAFRFSFNDKQVFWAPFGSLNVHVDTHVCRHCLRELFGFCVRVCFNTDLMTSTHYGLYLRCVVSHGDSP